MPVTDRHSRTSDADNPGNKENFSHGGAVSVFSEQQHKCHESTEFFHLTISLQGTAH